MGKLFYIMGKSASGKDSIYAKLLSRRELGLKPFVIYTTRPIRAHETDGVEYHFVDEARMRQMEMAGRIIELRVYHTIQGPWYYFTADDGKISLADNSYLAVGTLESYQKLCLYYGKDKVVPIYIEVEDGERLERALCRERREDSPDYEEMCRRFLADQEDFSEENIRAAGILRRFYNRKQEVCVKEIAAYIQSVSTVKENILTASHTDQIMVY